MSKTVLFPSVSTEDFDGNEKWAVSRIDQEKREIEYVGLGKNGHLSFTQSFENEQERFELLAEEYISQKKDIQKQRVEEFQLGMLSKEEYEAPIVIEVSFPEAFFVLEDSRLD